MSSELYNIWRNDISRELGDGYLYSTIPEKILFDALRDSKVIEILVPILKTKMETLNDEEMNKFILPKLSREHKQRRRPKNEHTRISKKRD
jgi:hypothetical protein